MQPSQSHDNFHLHAHHYRYLTRQDDSFRVPLLVPPRARFCSGNQLALQRRSRCGVSWNASWSRGLLISTLCRVSRGGSVDKLEVRTLSTCIDVPYMVACDDVECGLGAGRYSGGNVPPPNPHSTSSHGMRQQGGGQQGGGQQGGGQRSGGITMLLPLMAVESTGFSVHSASVTSEGGQVFPDGTCLWSMVGTQWLRDHHLILVCCSSRYVPETRGHTIGQIKATLRATRLPHKSDPLLHDMASVLPMDT